MSSEQTGEVFVKSLVGRRLISLDRHEYTWSFVFDDATTLVTQGSWRILAEGRISLSDSDDAQQFGLPNPVDAKAHASQLVLGKAVHDASVRGDTGDLTIGFGGGLVLEALNTSSGYEAWQINKPQAGTLICTGGGKLVVA